MASSYYERLPEWPEEKSELHIFEEFPPTDPCAINTSSYIDYSQVYEQTFPKIQQVTTLQPSLCHLTPPQSPPGLYSTLQPPSPIWQTVPIPVESTTEYNVDELVLQAVQDITWQEPQTNINGHNGVVYENEFSVTQPIIETSQNGNISDEYSNPQSNSAYYSGDSSPSSCSPFSPSSSSCSTYGSSENDDDYIVRPKKTTKSRGNTRSKPYSRSVDEKKSRKKEQNKNAATRYRLKKKQEIEVLMGEEKELQDRHDELDSQYTDIRRQVSCLKKFLREVYEAKGLLPKK